MTACVNKKSKRVAAVVTASLVGALSIGAPAVALAANGGIEMLATEWYTKATITKAENGKGAVVSGDLSKAELKPATWLVPTQVANANGDLTDINDDDYVIRYYDAATAGNMVASTDAKIDAGKPEPKTFFTSTKTGTFYVSVAKKNSDGSGIVSNNETPRVAFKIVAEDEKSTLDGAYIYYGNDAKVKDIVYAGNATNKLTFSGLKVANAEGKYLSSASPTVYGNDGKVVTGDLAVGSYTAKVTNGTDEATIAFAVSALDLSKAGLSIADAAKDSGVTIASDLKINGKENTDLTDELTFVVKNSKGAYVDGSTAIMTAGTYTVTVSAKDADDKNIVNSGTFTFNVLDHCTAIDSNVQYDGKSAASALEFNLAKGEAFDASKVTVKIGTTVYKADQLELSFTDSEGNAVTAEDVTKAGTSETFTMQVRIKPVTDWATGETTGGSTSTGISIKISGAEVSKDENLAFYLNGKVSGDEGSVAYDGTDALKKLSVSVKAGGKTYEQGKDFTLEVKNSKGEVVETAVKVDDYTVEVKPITFTFTGSSESTFTLHVTKAVLTNGTTQSLKDFVDANSGTAFDADKDASLYYTGEAVSVPGAEYDSDDEAGASHVSFKAIDSSLYSVSSITYSEKDSSVASGTAVKELKAEGYYKVTIALTEEADECYTLTDADFIVQVKKKDNFADVLPSKWYAQSVYAAKVNNYVNGLAGSDVFMPEANISRADAVCILFNMANGTVGSDDFQVNEDKSYITGFNDVDGHAYYAKAIAWAKASGVANGSNGSFRPNDSITREEFAALLCNFAKAKGENVKVDSDAVLAGAIDFSAWAKDVVAWAKDNKVMGNGGFINGTGAITRAEVASMAVNYQPKKLG